MVIPNLGKTFVDDHFTSCIKSVNFIGGFHDRTEEHEKQIHSSNKTL